MNQSPILLAAASLWFSIAALFANDTGSFLILIGAAVLFTVLAIIAYKGVQDDNDRVR